MTDQPCHYAGDDRPRMLRTHQPDCDTASCAGCVPCPERHCRVDGHEHVTVDGRGTDLTCADCLSETRQRLTRIHDLTGLLTTAATERGVDSEAAMMAGPAAATDRWLRRHRLISDAAAAAPNENSPAWRAWLAWLDDCRDEQHPLWVLGQWDFAVRDHLGHLEHDTTLTLTDIVGYLDQHLTRLAHDKAFDFDQLAREIRTCWTTIERVLAVAPHTETGAPCPTCGRADLEKSYGDTAKDDRWTCPKCHQWWTEHDYRARVATIYTGVAPALTASQIREVYRVEEATVRKWAERGKVAKRGKDQHGRLLYDVAMVLDARDRQTAATA